LEEARKRQEEEVARKKEQEAREKQEVERRRVEDGKLEEIRRKEEDAKKQKEAGLDWQDRKWVIEDGAKVPGTAIELLMVTQVSRNSKLHHNVWNDKGKARGENFRVINNTIYRTPEEVINSFKNIMVLAADKAGLTVEQVLNAFKLAKAQGGIAHEVSDDGDYEESKNGDDEYAKLKKFSARCKKYAASSGLFTGREKFKELIGCRLTFFPEEAMLEFLKLRDDKSLKISADKVAKAQEEYDAVKKRVSDAIDLGRPR
jgi:hypothetical protein